jgi:hypothetical protein
MTRLLLYSNLHRVSKIHHLHSHLNLSSCLFKIQAPQGINVLLSILKINRNRILSEREALFLNIKDIDCQDEVVEVGIIVLPREPDIALHCLSFLLSHDSLETLFVKLVPLLIRMKGRIICDFLRLWFLSIQKAIQKRGCSLLLWLGITFSNMRRKAFFRF